MAVETNGAAIVAAFERSDDASIAEWVNGLPAERVVETLLAVTELRRALYVGEKALRTRIGGEELLSIGEPWTAPDGRSFFWAGDRERVCSDPSALRAALAELPLSKVARLALAAAFKEQPLKTYFTELDKVAQFGGNEAERTIRSFVSWREGPPKLRERNGEKP